MRIHQSNLMDTDREVPNEPQVTTGSGAASVDDDDGSVVPVQKRIREPEAVSDTLMGSKSPKRKKGEVENFTEAFEAQCSVLMERAKLLQAKLSPEFPSFIRLLWPSHVTEFKMGLPPEFCKSHLPKSSRIVVLEDESGKEYEVTLNFFVERWSLSAGWRCYSRDHKLLEGDVIIFHLIKPDRFKVYTLRAEEACVTETGTGSLAADSEDFGPVAADFEHFTISVNGLVVDTLLSRELRQSYHKLCCSQKSYLHSKLIKSIDESTLVAGIIFKTVHIANAIRSCKFSTSQNNFVIWDKTLEEFEELGMEVGFLRDRIKRLVSLASDLAVGSMRSQEGKDEQVRAEKKIKSLELDLRELKKRCGRLEGEIKSAKSSADNPERKKGEVQNVTEAFEAQCSELMERAKELQAKLSPEFPSFIRLMRRSHVTGAFWLGLPPEFCKLHLPKISKKVVLEDESGKEYEVTLLVERWSLSAGWRHYSRDHKLLEGDVIIFYLIKPDRFKVYTLRAEEACVTESGTGYLAADSEDFGPVAADFEDFTIAVNGLVVDTLLSREIRQSYHKLCCSQKSYLHRKLIKSVDESTLVARIIFKTVHIAKAIRSCKISTSQNNFAMWDKTLEEFEELGMEVGFLREQINRLALDSAAGSKRSQEATDEQDRAVKKFTSLELEVLELKKRCDRRLKGEIENAKENADKCKAMFEEEASAPW